MAIQVCRPARFIDERLNILNFTLNGIGAGIATIAASAPVIVIDRKATRQEFGKLRSGPGGPCTKRSRYQDDCRPVADLVVGDPGSIF